MDIQNFSKRTKCKSVFSISVLQQSFYRDDGLFVFFSFPSALSTLILSLHKIAFLFIYRDLEACFIINQIPFTLKLVQNIKRQRLLIKCCLSYFLKILWHILTIYVKNVIVASYIMILLCKKVLAQPISICRHLYRTYDRDAIMSGIC